MNQQAFDDNRANWNERVPIHLESEMYRQDLSQLRAGGHCLKEESVRHIGDLTGKRAIHLQCHMGMETVSLARLGAESVGVDFSQPAVDVGNDLAKELDLPARFVCCNVYDTLDHVEGKFDLVFVTTGALCWLPDVGRWAEIVAALLKPGGVLYLNEVHPFGDVFEDTADGKGLEIMYPYFAQETSTVFNESATYADLSAELKNTRTHDWPHPISEVLTAALDAGLSIERFEESAECGFPRFAAMKQVSVNSWKLPESIVDSIPHMYTLVAKKKP